MIGQLPADAEPILADARRLSLGRRFDVVLLASHLVNGAAGDGPAFLRVTREHVLPAGAVVAEVYPPGLDWGAAVGRPRPAGEVTVTVTRAAVTDGRLDAEVRYEVDGRTWRQPFAAERLSEEDVLSVLAAEGFRFERWLARERGWLLARPR